MQGEATTRVDWDLLAGKSAKQLAAFAGVIGVLLAIPALNTDGGPRLAVAAALGAAALVAILSGFGMVRRRKDATEGAARAVMGIIMAAVALWFSNLVPAPQVIQATSVSERLGVVIQTVGGTPRQGLNARLGWTVSGDAGAARRLVAPIEEALSTKAATRAVGEDARQVSAAMAISARAGSLAGGQVTATARVALAANGAPVCRFTVSTLRPMPLAAAAERLAEQALDRAQTYVEGRDLC